MPSVFNIQIGEGGKGQPCSRNPKCNFESGWAEKCSDSASTLRSYIAVTLHFDSRCVLMHLLPVNDTNILTTVV